MKIEDDEALAVRLSRVAVGAAWIGLVAALAVVGNGAGAAGNLTIDILAPAEGSDFDIPTVNVSGTVSPGAKVQVDGLLAFVDGNGSWAVRLALGEGPNNVVARAWDDGGNETAASVNVTFTNPLWGVVGDLADANAEINATNAELSFTEDQLAEAQAEIADLLAATTRFDGEIAQLQAALDDAVANGSISEAAMLELRGDLLDAQAALIRAQSDIVELQAQMAEAQANRTETWATLTDSRADLNETRADLAEAQARVDAIGLELQGNQVELVEAQNAAAAASTEASRASGAAGTSMGVAFFGLVVGGVGVFLSFARGRGRQDR
jgi:predicted  nucleic acid-binding Zn-ribbon protein